MTELCPKLLAMLLKFTFLLAFTAATVWPQIEVLATGLQGASKVILTPRGNFLVSETSMALNAGRVSFVSRAGIRRSLIEGLPSGVEVTLAGGSGPSALALTGRTLYVAMGGGDAERRGTAPGTSMHNPAGASSAIFATILEFRLSGDVDTLAGTFKLTPAQQTELADGATLNLDDGSGTKAEVSILTRFPISEPDRMLIYRFSNPWGMVVADEGKALYVSDASQNSLARVDTATGRWQRVARFGPVANPTPVGPPMVDSVPTSIRVYGEELLVSFLTGFPFAPGNARVMALNPKTGMTSPFINQLTSAVDVLWWTRPNGRPQFFVLEFSANQSATPPPPGRLLRYDSPAPVVAAAGLITPVNMVLDEATQELFILELRGQILRLKLD